MKSQYIFAQTLDEALDVSVASRHIRKKVGIRKWQDVTDLSVKQYHGTQEALESNQSGVGKHTEIQGWVISNPT